MSACLVGLGLTCQAASAAAQVTPPTPTTPQISVPDESRARLRLGPVMLSPVIELNNLGVDTNVFDQPSGQEQDDFMFALSPHSDIWMKLGPTWISGNVREDLIWYQTFGSARAANTTTVVNWIVPLNRLVFSVGTGYIWAKERPGYEIDVRAPRQEVQFNGVVEVRALSRTFFGAQANRRHVEFQDETAFVGTVLRQELNRVSTNVAVDARHELTPLTSISIDGGRNSDRFDYSPLRDTDSTFAGVQVTFDPSALISGSARVGYRDFQPIDHSVPSYQGSTVAVNLSYVLLGATRFGIQLSRDVQYSYDINQPYYLQNGIAGTIQQQIFGPVDVTAGLGFYSLAYRDRSGTIVLYPDRVDRNRSFNVGGGYHVTPDLRVGVRVEKQWRDTVVDPRQFNALRIGLVVTYGT